MGLDDSGLDDPARPAATYGPMEHHPIFEQPGLDNAPAPLYTQRILSWRAARSRLTPEGTLLAAIA